MKFVKTVSSIAKTGLIVALSATILNLTGIAKAGEDVTPYYPLKKPKYSEWSFSGPFGKWDIGQLQRGLKIYTQSCAACHSLDLVPFRSLYELGYSEEQVKAFAAEYEVTDGPNAEGEMFERPATPADRFPNPYANSVEAALANNGAVPPDFSLLAKARAPKRGFPNFVFDVFTLYAENGPDYIYSLLTGYSEAPQGKELSEGTYYNPYFAGGSAPAMAPPLSDDLIDYDDGTPQTVDQYAKDISAFLMWTAEPVLVERKQLGFKVMLFLIIFAVLLYFTKRQVFASLKD
ncbi:MAG: cytochrome c1 [Rhizobiaceae bacterium]|nr:cytochrome c1 [Rhizobiaceae bacterium]